MDKKELQAIAQAAAKNIKTEDDLNEFRAMLTKITVETALNVECPSFLEMSPLKFFRDVTFSRILVTKQQG